MNDTIPASERAQIEELRQGNIGRLFLLAHRNFSELAVQKLHHYGHSQLSLAHTNLLANLDTQGTRITVLAERAGVTKQAMGSLVSELERKGYIGRTADPTDGRAVLITFTAMGWQFLRDAYQVKQEIEAVYTAVLGETGFQTLQTLLATLLATRFEQ